MASRPPGTKGPSGTEGPTGGVKGVGAWAFSARAAAPHSTATASAQGVAQPTNSRKRPALEGRRTTAAPVRRAPIRAAMSIPLGNRRRGVPQ